MGFAKGAEGVGGIGVRDEGGGEHKEAALG